MSDDVHLNDLDAKINLKGYFDRVLREREKLEAERARTDDERFARIDDRFREIEKALELQAGEYARRLAALNGEYQRDVQRQSQYVTMDKYETGLRSEAEARTRETLRANERFDDYLEMYEKRHRELEDEVRSRTLQTQFEDYRKSESTARTNALLRVDEKFEEYVKRYEVRQREVDLLLAAQAGAADEAKRAVEEQGRKSDAQSRELARRQSRNLGLASLGLGLIVFFANIIPLLTGH